MALGRVLFQVPRRALDPAGGFEVDARIGVEVIEVSLLLPKKKVMQSCPRDDQRNDFGRQADHAVAAQGIAQQRRRRTSTHPRRRALPPAAPTCRARFVQTLGQEFQVDAVGRTGHGRDSSRKGSRRQSISTHCSSMLLVLRWPRFPALSLKSRICLLLPRGHETGSPRRGWSGNAAGPRRIGLEKSSAAGE